jgi:hypothetical protein
MRTSPVERTEYLEERGRRRFQPRTWELLGVVNSFKYSCEEVFGATILNNGQLVGAAASWNSYWDPTSSQVDRLPEFQLLFDQR